MSEYIITGTVVPQADATRIGTKVQAFDRDLPSLERRAGSAPQVLGEAITDSAGRFQITYTLEQFQSGEGISLFNRAKEESADLTFRVFDRTGQELTIRRIQALGRECRPDQIIFNVPASVEVTIFLALPLAPARASEFEQLIAQLAPVIQDVDLTKLSQDDITFLFNELGLEQQPGTLQHIEWLRRSALLARDTSLPIEAFYGWGRENLPAQLAELATVPPENLPAVLEKLTRFGVDTLHKALLAAVDQHVIPASIRERVDEIVRQLVQRGQDLIQINARLVDEETGVPLAGYSVRNVGLRLTDQDGNFFFTFYQARDLPATAPAQQFSFQVITPTGQPLQDKAPVAITRNHLTTDLVTVKVRIPRPTVPTLEEQLQSANLLAPLAVLTWLKAKGIATFADIRRKGGLSKVDGAPSVHATVIGKLDSLADLDRISASANVSTVLLDKGYDSVLAVADAPYSEFIANVSDGKTTLTQIEVAKLHVMATTQTNLLNDILIRIAVDKANGFVLPAQPENQTGANS